MSLTYDDLAHEAAERFDTSGMTRLQIVHLEALASDLDNANDTIAELRRQLDQARVIAVDLEQENAELAKHVAVQAAGQEAYRDAVQARRCEHCTGGAA